LSSVPLEDQELQLQTMKHPSSGEEIEVFHPTYMQSSHFKANYPVVGIAALPPLPSSLGGDIFLIGSPRHHLFDTALRDEAEETVPVSILHLRPFVYVFNHTIRGSDKVYNKDDPRLKSGTRDDKRGTPERKRYWEVNTIWTGVDFGAGPGGIAVVEIGEKIVVLGVGGGIACQSLFLIVGIKGGVVVCSVHPGRQDASIAGAVVN
jgi:hypothetical protein